MRQSLSTQPSATPGTGASWSQLYLTRSLGLDHVSMCHYLPHSGPGWLGIELQTWPKHDACLKSTVQDGNLMIRGFCESEGTIGYRESVQAGSRAPKEASWSK